MGKYVRSVVVELCELYLPVNFTVGKIDVTINCRPKLSLHGVVLLTSGGVEKARVHGIHHMLQRRRVIFNGRTCQGRQPEEVEKEPVIQI